jgi:hypothetical protein
MYKKLTVAFWTLFLSSSIGAAAHVGESLESNFDTPNKLMLLCEGNHLQQEMCLSYLVGFITATRIASVVPILKFNHQEASNVSTLTIERKIKNTITNKPELGDVSTEAMLLSKLRELKIIQYQIKS